MVECCGRYDPLTTAQYLAMHQVVSRIYSYLYNRRLQLSVYQLK